MTRLLVVGSEGFIGFAVAHTLSEMGEIFRADIASPTDQSNYTRIDPIEPDLIGLIEKAEASPGGFIAGAVAYRSDYTQARALAAAADRAARLNNCDAPKPN